MRRNDREVKGREEIEDIILQCKTCHVAMVDDGTPYIVPLSFGHRFIGGRLELYFHSAHEGRKISILKKNNRVCFEMSDEGEPLFPEVPCKSGYFYASVIGNGEAFFIEDAAEKCDALSIMFKHQSGRDVVFTPEQAGTVCVFKIVSSDFTGKKKPRPNM
jgi:nitroimidazol reductase NimA-like FMN-containing flavoprotein (pyridoxamine 5'-phosphate oxidase superfamily)